MKPIYQLSLHIFRRDLRLNDNTALIEALKSSIQVIPCFIFDKRQIESNSYFSHHAFQFMLDSLNELNQELKKKKGKLYIFYGMAEKIVEQLVQSLPLDAIFYNRDYTPFSIKRDFSIKKICQKYRIFHHCFADALLHEPEQVLKKNQKPYTIFTPFYKKAMEIPVTFPEKNNFSNFYKKKIPHEENNLLSQLSRTDSGVFVKGGRKAALKLLKKIPKLTNYKKNRNFPGLDSVSRLSPHNKFGTISIREFYNTIDKYFGRKHDLIKELYWRDFFTHVVFYFPHVLGTSFNQKFTHLVWKNNKSHFKAWCEGKTGFPIVDAGMRELNTTGYMHNRVRMITASFLVKDLQIDWRWGEKYFAQQLVDYDPAVNNGNWQWIASTGCDAQPYFRIFNPWLQQQKFDPDCIYIKHWVPELATLSNKVIHQIYQEQIKGYPMPIVDHSLESQAAKKNYRKANA